MDENENVGADPVTPEVTETPAPEAPVVESPAVEAPVVEETPAEVVAEETPAEPLPEAESIDEVNAGAPAPEGSAYEQHPSDGQPV